MTVSRLLGVLLVLTGGLWFAYVRDQEAPRPSSECAGHPQVVTWCQDRCSLEQQEDVNKHAKRE